MSVPKRALCIMDLASVGRASLAVALPVLSACGAQGCPMPASLFSTHTGGFTGVAVRDVSDFCIESLKQYFYEEVEFDAVYSGYLRGEGQFAAVRAAFVQYPDAFKVVDPSLGDNGRLYSGIGADTVEAMRALCRDADLITPNATECALLTGRAPGAAFSPAEQEASLAAVSALSEKGADVLATSVDGPNGTRRVLGLSRAEGAFSLSYVPQQKGFPGTGDLFTSAVTGLVLAGRTLRDAAETAAKFVSMSIDATINAGTEHRYGVHFEQYLPLLILAARGREEYADTKPN